MQSDGHVSCEAGPTECAPVLAWTYTCVTLALPGPGTVVVEVALTLCRVC
jgi:hypothetical protein